MRPRSPSRMIGYADELAGAVVGDLAAPLDPDDLDPAPPQLARRGEDMGVVGLAAERQDGVVLEEQQAVADLAVGPLRDEAPSASPTPRDNRSGRARTRRCRAALPRSDDSKATLRGRLTRCLPAPSRTIGSLSEGAPGVDHVPCRRNAGNIDANSVTRPRSGPRPRSRLSRLGAVTLAACSRSPASSRRSRAGPTGLTGATATAPTTGSSTRRCAS